MNTSTIPITAKPARTASVMILSRRMRGIGLSMLHGLEKAVTAGTQDSSSVCMGRLYVANHLTDRVNLPTRSASYQWDGSRPGSGAGFAQEQALT